MIIRNVDAEVREHFASASLMFVNPLGHRSTITCPRVLFPRNASQRVAVGSFNLKSILVRIQCPARRSGASFAGTCFIEHDNVPDVLFVAVQDGRMIVKMATAGPALEINAAWCRRIRRVRQRVFAEALRGLLGT